MNERDEIDILAGEYVLGTLDAAERTAVSARRQRDPALNAAIEAWEHRLAPLADTVPPVAVPEGLREKIEALADARLAEDATQIVVLARRAERWRRLAIGASALAACLLITIDVRELWRPPAAKSYVAVFQKDDASPAFLLTVDLDTRVLSVRPVAGRAATRKELSALDGFG
jgi:anti-sigma-K factor RskA